MDMERIKDFPSLKYIIPWGLELSFSTKTDSARRAIWARRSLGYSNKYTRSLIHTHNLFSEHLLKKWKFRHRSKSLFRPSQTIARFHFLHINPTYPFPIHLSSSPPPQRNILFPSSWLLLGYSFVSLSCCEIRVQMPDPCRCLR